ncbi:TIM barrel protein [Luteitalea sp.]|uniref:sugar phosphate isomerase/epimerase family protein n=1 Tax=Luteitalea sp. TaxID=2004800 RepID=UPI0025C61031|nr:TIM barrel protein [Luteitalea sp.]
MTHQRRQFLRNAGVGLGTLWLTGCASNDGTPGEAARPLFFKMSLAEWSLHKTILEDKTLDNLEFAATARHKYGIEAIEYVNLMFADKARNAAYLAELNKRAADNGVQQLLIMIDSEGGMAETDTKKLAESVENHKKWVDAAATLGCHSIRVNAFSSNPKAEEAAKAAVEGLGKLGEYGAKAGINIIVENHGGFSSNGAWLAGVMRTINQPNVGTLPDFGNFCVATDSKDGDPWSGTCLEEYDRYTGMAEMMPFAKGVSAKAQEFDAEGNCIETDYRRMLTVVKDAGYTGYLGIEFSGTKPEDEGIRLTKALLEAVGAELG